MKPVLICAVDSVETYVLKDYRDEPETEQVSFNFRKLSRVQRDTIEDGTYKFNGTALDKILTNTVKTRLTVASLDGWKNVVDANGNAVQFDKKNREDMFDLLPSEVQDELIAHVNRSREDAPDKKAARDLASLTVKEESE